MSSSAVVVILGAGPGGYSAALRAARTGARVTLVDCPQTEAEQGEGAGGVCLHRGCIPTKTLLASADLLRRAGRAGDLGVQVSAETPDWPVLRARQQRIVAGLAKGVEFLLKRAGVSFLAGRGKLVGGRRVEILAGNGEKQEMAADKIILATGAHPAALPGFACDGRRVFNSDQLLRLDRIPRQLAVVGGGYIGCEFASLFAALGTKVEIYELTEQLLPGMDAELGAGLARSFQKQGITVRTGIRLGGPAELANADAILVSVGREPNLNTFNREAENLALDLSGKFLRVDEGLQTSASGIFAVGDITGKALLAHVALAQARVAVENALAEAGQTPRAMDYRIIPACVFTHPEIASVGLTEAQARTQGQAVKIGKFPFAALGRAAAEAEAEGFVKLIADAGTGKILGGQVLGGVASEQIGVVALAIQQGVTACELAELIVAHPTFNEALAEAAEAIYGQPLHLARNPGK